MPDSYDTQVVGFGPSALGLFLAADRRGLADGLLERGVLVVERARSRRAAQDARLPFIIQSNSPASDFLGGIDRLHRYAAVRGCASTTVLSRAGRSTVPLRDVGQFLKVLSELIESDLTHQQRAVFVMAFASTAYRSTAPVSLRREPPTENRSRARRLSCSLRAATKTHPPC